MNRFYKSPDRIFVLGRITFLKTFVVRFNIFLSLRFRPSPAPIGKARSGWRFLCTHIFLTAG